MLLDGPCATPEAAHLEASVFEGSHETLAVHGGDGNGAGMRVFEIDEAEAPRCARRPVSHQLRPRKPSRSDVGHACSLLVAAASGRANA